MDTKQLQTETVRDISVYCLFIQRRQNPVIERGLYSTLSISTPACFVQ
jgi:hypothetical protein